MRGCRWRCRSRDPLRITCRNYTLISRMVLDVLKPLIDRKIIGGAKHTGYKMQWAMNDVFKRGLRNALTGM